MKFSQQPFCFTSAFSAHGSKELVTERGSSSVYEYLRRGYDINLSSIATILIQNVGRFCERYASDFLITWNSVNRILESDEQNFDELILFGIRENGVDHDAYILSNLEQYKNLPGYFDHYYRKIFALRLQASSGMMTATLKDIKHSLYYTNEPPGELVITSPLGTKLPFVFKSKQDSDALEASIMLKDGSFIKIVYGTPDDNYFQNTVFSANKIYTVIHTDSVNSEVISAAETLKGLSSGLKTYLEDMPSDIIP